MAAARGRARRPKKARRVGGARVRRRAFALLARLVAEHQIPESHGAGHARAVHRHVSRALRGEKVPANKRLGLQLGAVLHDADDPKYFSGAPGLLPNARAILGAALRGYPGAPRVRRLALEAISHVSASANGNSAPPRAAEFPQLLYPRWADRLEQLGEGGVFRTHLYSEERGRPLAVAATPAPATAAEARAAATPSASRTTWRGKAAARPPSTTSTTSSCTSRPPSSPRATRTSAPGPRRATRPSSRPASPRARGPSRSASTWRGSVGGEGRRRLCPGEI